MAGSRAERPLVELVVALLVADATLAVFLPAVGHGFVAREAQWDEAMEHYRAALLLQPGFVEARWNMTVAQEAMKKLP